MKNFNLSQELRRQQIRLMQRPGTECSPSLIRELRRKAKDVLASRASLEEWLERMEELWNTEGSRVEQLEARAMYFTLLELVRGEIATRLQREGN